MSSQTRKKMLFVHRSYDLLRAQEMLDAALMASSFNQIVSLMFLNDSVFLLNKNQNLELIGIKNFIAAYKALSLYDIENVYLDAVILKQADLSAEELLVTGAIVNPEKISEIIHHQDIILNF